jgi:hypothetical protein
MLSTAGRELPPPAARKINLPKVPINSGGLSLLQERTQALGTTTLGRVVSLGGCKVVRRSFPCLTVAFLLLSTKRWGVLGGGD